VPRRYIQAVTTPARERRHALPLTALSLAVAATGIGAYVLNPVLGLGADRDPIENDLGIQVFVSNVESSSAPAIRLHADQAGATLHVDISVDEGIIGFGEIAIARTTGTAEAVEAAPLTCTAVYNQRTDAGNLGVDKPGDLSTVDADPLYRQWWIELGQVGVATQVHGSMTAIHVPPNDGAAKIRVACPIAGTARWQDTLAQTSLLLPSIRAAALHGGVYPVTTMSVAKDPGEFMVQTSFTPDVVEVDQFVWTAERMAAVDAGGGVLMTTSSPTAGRQAEVRIFMSGVLAAMASALLVTLLGCLLRCLRHYELVPQRPVVKSAKRASSKASGSV
jgi:hypothetical protein